MQVIPIQNLAIMLVPVLLVGYIAYRWTAKTADFGIAVARMVLQLLLVGYILVFLFEQANPWLGLGILSFMLVISSYISMRTVPEQRWKLLPKALLSVTIGGGVTLALVLLGVLGLDPWYQPRFVIPLAGMIFANAMTSLSLCGERFENETGNGRHYRDARRIAFNTALIPQINAFLAVGLVSLPGMMTGQILSGVSPLIAVRYQIMVMAMVLSSAGITTAVYLLLLRPAKAQSEMPAP